MRLKDFEFFIPPELIAQTPVYPRDQARLLVYHRLTGQVEHRNITDLPGYFAEGDLIVANNSRVRKARLFALSESGKKVEIMVLEETEKGTGIYRCLLGGNRATFVKHLTIYLDEERTEETSLQASILERETDSRMDTFLVRFSCPALPLEKAFEQYGQAPLPPYIQTKITDSERYQTVFAKALGSAAAPTAGLHFTPELIAKIKKQGILWEEVTLHVGLGTFLPLRSEEIEANKLHTEVTEIDPGTAQIINDKIKENKRILGVGTTSVRTLESHFQPPGRIIGGPSSTNLFIYPGYKFRAVNTLLTNFHLPHSSLLLLVAAFLGNHPQNKELICNPEAMIDILHRLYQTAIAEKYRFYSFGDAMLIL